MNCVLLLLGLLACTTASGIFQTGKHHKRQGQWRVDVSECAVDAERRTDCGYYGIARDECASRQCCWVESNLPGVPWCYHTISQSHDICIMHESEREDCGYYGIKAEQCEGNGCCWKPTQVANTPWCFYPSGPIPGSGEGSCGSPVISPSVIGRIVGGEDAIPHSWPWQVSIQNPPGEHQCGGSLIAPQWVISAAHCEPYFAGQIAIGLHYYETPGPVTEELEAEWYLAHPDFNWGTFDNDIALIKLARPVNLRNEISTVCLPRKELPEGTACYSTGWGALSSQGGPPEVLQQVMLPIVDRFTCNDWYGDQITENMVCAGIEQGGIDSCQGDSGGPFVCSDEGHWVLSGIVSWGEGCADERKPGVYTNVINYLDWIDQHMAEHA